MKNVPKVLIVVGIIAILIIINELIIKPFKFNYHNSSPDYYYTTEEIMNINNKFSQYFGNHVQSADVKALLTMIMSSNAMTEDNSRAGKIYVRGIGNTPEDAMAAVVIGKKYNVNVNNDEYSKNKDDDNDDGTGYYSSGRIKTIKIIPNEE